MNEKMKNTLYKFQKIGALTFVFIFLSITLLILLIYPILETIFKEDIFTMIQTFQTAYVIEAIIWSFLTSLMSTTLALILGVPIAYLLAKYDFPGKSIIDSAIDLPLLIPHSVAGIMLLFAFGSNGVFGEFFSFFGISFFDTPWGITIAMFFVSSPILIKGMRDAFLKIDPNLEKAARTLGASKSRVFLDVHLQLSGHDMLSNSILCWARGLSEFGAVYILAAFPRTGATLVFYEYTGSGIEAARPIAIALILISIGIFILLRLIENQAKKREGLK